MHIQLNDNKDTFKWNLKANRIFTVHSMYLAVINNGVGVTLLKIILLNEIGMVTSNSIQHFRNMFWIETTSTSGRNDVKQLLEVDKDNLLVSDPLKNAKKNIRQLF
ncbi:hypothetical protein ACJX0J_018332 [Zea mays]